MQKLERFRQCPCVSSLQTRWVYKNLGWRKSSKWALITLPFIFFFMYLRLSTLQNKCLYEQKGFAICKNMLFSM